MREQTHTETPRPGNRQPTARLVALAAAVVVILGAVGVTLALTLPGGSTPRQSRAASAPSLAVASFAGYPGQTSPAGASRLTVNAIASAGGLRLAAGSTGGYPAIWKQGADGNWALVTARQGLPPSAAITTLTHGPAGWLAVGVPGPVVFTSPNGTGWHEAAGGITADLGKIAEAAAAGGVHGYIIMGKLQVGTGCVADVWWSPNLTDWTRAHDTNDVTGSSQTLAVAATPAGFVSVGSHEGKPAAWITSNGTTWRTVTLPAPANSQLNQIAVIGSRVIAAGGTDGQGSGTPAFAVSSSDGGNVWHLTQLRLPASETVVTAMAAAGHGFVAAGRYGQPGHVVVWRLSLTGTAWTQAVLAGMDRTHEITALGADGADVTGVGPVDPVASPKAAIFTLSAVR